MRTLLGVSIAAVLLGSMANPASAATENRFQTAQGGVVCKPTTSSGSTTLVAKATGLRNEGTAVTYIICGFESSNSRSDIGTIQQITMAMYSLNGTSKSVSCTAVNGFANGAPIYATKAINTNTDGTQAVLSFDATDFGGVAGSALPESDFWSVTCALPASTSVGYMTTKFTVNVPNTPA